MSNGNLPTNRRYFPYHQINYVTDFNVSADDISAGISAFYTVSVGDSYYNISVNTFKEEYVIKSNFLIAEATRIQFIERWMLCLAKTNDMPFLYKDIIVLNLTYDSL